jgi:tetratricopeptide (TPR) repeat protein
MSSQCDKLYLFLDGELGSVDEESFRHHLARCEACATGLHEAMQLEMLSLYALGEGEPPPRLEAVPPVKPERAPRLPFLRVLPGGRHIAGAALVLAVGLAALIVFSPSPSAVSREVWLAQAPTRLLEARVAYARADGHRPYAPLRSAGETSSDLPRPPPLRELADLEDEGDLHGIAAAYLVRKDWRQASDFLQRSPPSPDRDSDRAIIALEQGHLDEALTRLDGVLSRVPAHPQALWNRALVLREQGLTLLAAEAFEAVAKLGEPGWSEEALIRARALRHETQARGRPWKAGLAVVD